MDPKRVFHCIAKAFFGQLKVLEVRVTAFSPSWSVGPENSGGGGFAACGRRVSFFSLCRGGLWPPVLQSFALLGEFLFHVEKEPKDARGRAQSAVRQASRLHAVRPPGTPIYGSPIRQQLRLSQRRGGTLIDRVSISAAAPFLVAVRWYFYQQTARLLA